MEDNKASELAKLIYSSLQKTTPQSTISLIAKELEKERTNKLSITKTPLLISIGQELGKLLLREEWRWGKLLELWRKGDRDEKLIVIGAVSSLSNREYTNSKQFVSEIIEEISGWEICDQLALRIIVNLMLQDQEAMLAILQKWIKSRNKWIRRLAIATIPPYIRAKKEEAKTCLDLLEEVMQEKDTDVKKAISWALREVTKKAPSLVFEFLMKWKNIEDRNTKWIIREGMKKLSLKDQEKLWDSSPR